MTDEQSDRASVRDWVDRHLALVLIATFIYLTGLGVAVVIVGLKAYQTAEQNREAACQLRNDQQARYTQNVNFLNEHPNGADVGDLHVSRVDLLRMIDGLRRNVTALAGLDCGEPVHLEPPAPPVTTSLP